MRDILIKNFLRISNIPRGSGSEEKIADFFVKIAQENNLYYYKDQNNNVLIKKKGNIASEPIALQAHLDMVCVKENWSNHNFKEEGIEVLINGDEVTANGTSLGADQGVGLAMMLTIIEDNSLSYPDLEFIFTTEEETTFNGAVKFEYSKLNSKIMINLDNSKDNSVFIGADGDICNEYTFSGDLINNNYDSYKISIDGLLGGNSGENIELSKTNAITTMANILNNKDIFLSSINGGTTENDIAISCEAIINTSADVKELFKDCEVKIEKIDNQLCFSKEDTKKIINEILQLESGYITANNASANLGMIKTCNDKVKIYYVFRSSVEEELENINENMKSLANDFHVKEIYQDCIWKADNESKLLKRYKDIYFNECATYPKEEICRGSIECATIKKRIDGLDIISIGSNMENIHTTKEKSYISSWVKVYKLLLEILKSFNR